MKLFFRQIQNVIQVRYYIKISIGNHQLGPLYKVSNLVWSYLATWMIFSTKYEILVKFARRSGFETFLYIIEFQHIGPNYRSDSIRNEKRTPKMYFQAVYILGNFWKFWSLLSGFVKANLAFGLIYVGSKGEDVLSKRV